MAMLIYQLVKPRHDTLPSGYQDTSHQSKGGPAGACFSGNLPQGFGKHRA